MEGKKLFPLALIVVLVIGLLVLVTWRNAPKPNSNPFADTPLPGDNASVAEEADVPQGSPETLAFRKRFAEEAVNADDLENDPLVDTEKLQSWAQSLSNADLNEMARIAAEPSASAVHRQAAIHFLGLNKNATVTNLLFAYLEAAKPKLKNDNEINLALLAIDALSGREFTPEQEQKITLWHTQEPNASIKNQYGMLIESRRRGDSEYIKKAEDESADEAMQQLSP